MKLRGLSYAELSARFKEAGLPHSRSHVTRAMRHAGMLPFQPTYKTVRWEVADVTEVIRKILHAGKTPARNVPNRKIK